MKSLKYFFGALLISAVGFTSCNNDDPVPPTPPPPPPSTLPEVEAREGYVALVLNTVTQADVCNGLVFAGSYNDWNTNPNYMVHFEAIEGYPNWWLAYIPMTDLAEDAEYMRGKPNQLDSDGNFPSSWDYQWHALMDAAGEVDREVEVISGRAELQPDYNFEQSLVVMLDADVVYIRTHSWLRNPCVEAETYTITFNVTVPELDEEHVVYINGHMFDWTATPMNRTNNPNVWTITVDDVEFGAEYRYILNGSWDYEELTAGECGDRFPAVGNRRVNDRTMNDTVGNFQNVTAPRCPPTEED